MKDMEILIMEEMEDTVQIVTFHSGINTTEEGKERWQTSTKRKCSSVAVKEM